VLLDDRDVLRCGNHLAGLSMVGGLSDLNAMVVWSRTQGKFTDFARLGRWFCGWSFSICGLVYSGSLVKIRLQPWGIPVFILFMSLYNCTSSAFPLLPGLVLQLDRNSILLATV
jgi:hypothetical protein